METPFGSVRVREAGAGRPLLMAHGLFTSSATFDAFLRQPPPGCRALALDHPGFGDSSPAPGFVPTWEALADNLLAVADGLGVDRFDLVGHSMGGGAAILAAARAPERVERLVLVDAVALSFEGPLKGRLLGVPILGEGLIRLYGRRMFLDYFAHEVFHDAAAMNVEKVMAYYEVLRRRRMLHLAAVRTTTRPSPIAAVLDRVRAATLVVWGEHDTLVPRALGEEVSRRIGGARFKVIPGSGHSPFEERPAETVAAVAGFLAS